MYQLDDVVNPIENDSQHLWNLVYRQWDDVKHFFRKEILISFPFYSHWMSVSIPILSPLLLLISMIYIYICIPIISLSTSIPSLFPISNHVLGKRVGLSPNSISRSHIFYSHLFPTIFPLMDAFSILFPLFPLYSHIPGGSSSNPIPLPILFPFPIPYSHIFALFFGMILVYAPQQKAWLMGRLPFWDGWPYPIASGYVKIAKWKITIVHG